MSEPSAGAARNGARIAAAVLVLVVLSYGAWHYRTRSPETAPPPAALPAATSTVEVTAAPASAAAPHAPPPASSPVVPAASATERLQARLDAIAKAYNTADSRAMEQALWSNHAVVRPDGQTYYRSDLMAQWAREWAEYRNPSLSFAIEEVSESGNQVTALWGVILTAEVLDPQGEAHQLQFSGSQKAIYRVDNGEEILQGPIVYTWSETTMDGYPWRPDQGNT